MFTAYLLFILCIICFLGYFLREYRCSAFYWCDVIVSFILSFIISSGFDTCPFFAGRIDDDSTVFLYIAKRMQEGRIPYADMFDHKGPLLYFILRSREIIPMR